ncbi:CDP-alcohol phosphatidyltransferase family protein [Aliarcobacter butzleri]|uniref:CDP-alcohol phosphatidyltransferase family protein n=1 Tax=Aliarcobacter butzleri TaxID=28197 RepID=UPI001EDB41E5|nr:CDP-alcohol phosphatidyltransferase family protein [Aliarcobacter butzleri]MCG3671301.1 CDP-alcohol phosphatidyltransferase family protein [Aliarcobacter butzleri]MCG3689313.1 CDP-alcohol phosphatidyltransferase family protein [Aliarcobacter butzleri]
MKDSNRRPLKVRGSVWSQKFASYLSKKDITPNQISIASIVASFTASIFILLISNDNFFTIWISPILAALFIQMRLLCNLFDGMVALEGGKSTKSGELFNDIPDRVSDSLLFIALGYSITNVSFGIELGYLAALFAALTAYVRVLGASMQAGSCFKGPMAKQHRMAILTTALILTPFELSLFATDYILTITLFIITIGSFLTIVNRTKTIYNTLEGK